MTSRAIRTKLLFAAITALSLSVLRDDSALADAPSSRFIVGSETIHDSLTGLVWERVSPSAKMTWADATAHCSRLTLGGSSFRLPAPNELLSIMDVDKQAPAVDTSVFGDVGPIDEYWSLAPSAVAHSAVWKGYAQWGSSKATANRNVASARARCVASR